MVVDGRAMAERIQEELQEEVAALKGQTGIMPGLAMISVGEDFPRQVFFRRQQVACNRVGITLFALCLPCATSQEEVIGLMQKLNTSPLVHGILIQLPLPAHLEATAIFQALDPRKDVDGLHPLNIGELLAGTAALVPVTLSAILEIFERNRVELMGKRALILGRAEGFARPLAMLLVNRFATVSVASQWDDGVVDLLKKAEILITDLYRPQSITGEMVRPGSLIIDLGFNARQGRLIGDVESSSASQVAALLAPVPGGVGPLIVSMLLKNTVMAYRRQVLGLEVDVEEIWRRGR
ncbi:MAG: bifunctional 5,10-methylenetetrahydrofolate dehydrogenase/5,10-methenyltetrahydrofolate cyclohydrolase [Nitrospinae bacterium]|nr:bifunctional 5,10-methylenetetrahydrofolate dehydrogenase/5,10-methenyltetrahydrofolate cyclohydrolase [Nitrospinota bacterium]